MAIIVRSPHSGRPVRVREQDVGRAVRDEAGRILYVLARRDGSGHYGSLTRRGGEKEEQRALALAAEEPPAQDPVATPAHDATGRRRARRGRLVILALALILAALALLFSAYGPWHPAKFPRVQTPAPNPMGLGPEGR